MAEVTLPPAGWVARRPLDGHLISWELDSPTGHITIRVGGRDPRLWLRTGPSNFGPQLEDPAAVHQLADMVHEGLLAAASVLEHAPKPPRQFTFADYEEARHA